MTEQEMVEGIAARDERAFAVFVERYEPLIRQVLWAITQSVADVDEGLNDVLMRVWRRIETYSPATGGGLGAWLNTVARNVAIDILRKRGRTLDTPSPTETTEFLNMSVSVDAVREARVMWGRIPRSPLEEALREEEVEALMKAVSRLSRQETRYLEVTRLYLEGKTTAEVAEQMGLCESTAKVQFFRAKARLRTLMGART